MVKEIILPQENNISNKIDLLYITYHTKGVIIACNNTIPIGYITYYGNEWFFRDTIDEEDCNLTSSTLPKMINMLIDKKIANTFKLIEFGNLNNEN